MVRINRVYTRSGDDGTTALVGGQRVGKDSLRIECYGTVDELNATLGMVRTALASSAAREVLLPKIERIQNELFNLGAELATPDAERRARSPGVSAADVTRLENEMDALNEDLPDLRSFILPGGGATSSALHLARTVCRRAERLLVHLERESDPVADAIPAHGIHYLNRLSDALFVFGRHAAAAEGEPEPLWEPS
jgi:cob(I)alamin adenosyltransferase